MLPLRHRHGRARVQLWRERLLVGALLCAERRAGASAVTTATFATITLATVAVGASATAAVSSSAAAIATSAAIAATAHAAVAVTATALTAARGGGCEWRERRRQL